MAPAFAEDFVPDCHPVSLEVHQLDSVGSLIFEDEKVSGMRIEIHRFANYAGQRRKTFAHISVICTQKNSHIAQRNQNQHSLNARITERIALLSAPAWINTAAPGKRSSTKPTPSGVDEFSGAANTSGTNEGVLLVSELFCSIASFRSWARS